MIRAASPPPSLSAASANNDSSSSSAPCAPTTAALVLEVPLGTVKGRLHRARAELIEVLRNNTYDWELPT
jgi:hypothetical protein